MASEIVYTLKNWGLCARWSRLGLWYPINLVVSRQSVTTQPKDWIGRLFWYIISRKTSLTIPVADISAVRPKKITPLGVVGLLTNTVEVVYQERGQQRQCIVARIPNREELLCAFQTVGIKVDRTLH